MAPTRGQIQTPGEAVARIAYLASDVVVSVQPSLAKDSEFSSHLKRYVARSDKSLVAKSSVTEVRNHSMHPLSWSFDLVTNCVCP
ncbi:hypothetical protein BDP55DRAFT_437995 [Colletotrichum godetiae]|uniref:Uncharacterized protein n=1 Tax=Colletotrichum godetiae TaxID=1209918 RepID=A0AAJ0A7T9_9PEZI|nr:uncharacterized protein BDP55DRAFT_437995 [Colletotrichum godetiae]KAK1657473.1 hypothetical protein BDP55DRAFT_437995 [Colletotrichum godetiae]